ncbi:hypothetical protein SNE40_010224 [Patella caerulea]|uniref:Uncharacterized protein n=1 Tax=Patella caerulea TaxID=87958 RepID=A0AAN8JVJ0_PATCE
MERENMKREDMKHEHMEQVLLSTEEIVLLTVNGCELGITCTVAIANTVFHQQWKLAKAQEEQTKTSVATMMMLKTFDDTYLIRLLPKTKKGIALHDFRDY